VEVPYEEGSSVRIGESMTDTYQLAQFHFHTPSEHAIDGKQYDAELHLVHKNILGEVVVVGVVLSKSETAPVGIFDAIVEAAPLAGGSVELEGMSLNALTLLPDESSYFTYTGSLTTPPCTESVRWFVMQKPVPVSDAVIRRLHTVVGLFSGYNGYPNNNRPIVPLNGRTVLAVK
jgi:carbonic anhydrase